MQDLENSEDESLLGHPKAFGKVISIIKGVSKFDRFCYHSNWGWLSDEVGMGKSLGVIALAASDGGKISPLLKPNHDLKGKIQIKATVVVTSVSLMGQWEDEVKIWRAPASTQAQASMEIISIQNVPPYQHVGNLQSLREAWASVCSIAFASTRRTYLGILCPCATTFLLWICSQRRWCVTATPCTSLFIELEHQLYFLGLGRVKTIRRLFRRMNKLRFLSALDLLSKRMARHTKAQRINGSKALALPKSTTHSVYAQINDHDKNI